MRSQYLTVRVRLLNARPSLLRSPPARQGVMDKIGKFRHPCRGVIEIVPKSSESIQDSV